MKKKLSPKQIVLMVVMFFSLALMVFFLCCFSENIPLLLTGIVVSIIVELVCIILLSLEQKRERPVGPVFAGTYPVTKKASYGWLFGGIVCGVLMVLYFLGVYHLGLRGWGYRSLSTSIGTLGIVCIIRFFVSCKTVYQLPCPSCGGEIWIKVGMQACDCPLCRERLIFSEGKFHTAQEVIERQRKEIPRGDDL